MSSSRAASCIHPSLIARARAPTRPSSLLRSVPDLVLRRVVLSADDEVNVAVFNAFPGEGMAYGTKEGRLRVMRYDRYDTQTGRGAYGLAWPVLWALRSGGWWVAGAGPPALRTDRQSLCVYTRVGQHPGGIL